MPCSEFLRGIFGYQYAFRMKKIPGSFEPGIFDGITWYCTRHGFRQSG